MGWRATDTISRMPDDLPVDVLTELGRVTWAAIRLEDYVEDLCSHIDPRDPRRPDGRFVSQKIGHAKKILAGWASSPVREAAAAWLERARRAIERRNAILHATPIAWTGPERGDHWLGLGETAWRDRPYFERPLTVESLHELRSVLEDAGDGWRDLVISIWAESAQQASSGTVGT
jgi:hypothetical protein